MAGESEDVGCCGPSCLLSLTWPQQWHGGVIRATITVIITILQLTVDRVAVCNSLLFDGEKGLHLHVVPGSQGRGSAWRETAGGSSGAAPPPEHTVRGPRVVRGSRCRGELLAELPAPTGPQEEVGSQALRPELFMASLGQKDPLV